MIGEELREQARRKHRPISQNQGKIGAIVYCEGCKTPSGVLATHWPCEVMQLVNSWEADEHL